MNGTVRGLTLRLLSSALLLPVGLSAYGQSSSTTEALGMPPGKIADLSGMKPFKRSNKVFVPGFRIALSTREKVSARAENFLGGGFGATGSKASMEAFLGGVDYATMQAAVDGAYAKFQDQLKAAGFEVIAPSAFVNSPTFKQIKTSTSGAGQAYNAKIGESQLVVISPTGLPLWWHSYEKWMGGGGDFSGDNLKTITKLTEELGATAIYPTLIVSFAGSESSGNSKFAKRASVGMTATIQVMANSMYWTQNGKDAGFGKTTRFVFLENSPGTSHELSKSDNETLVKAYNGAGINIGPVSGKKAIVIQEEPAAYKAGVMEAVSAVTQVLASGAATQKK